MDIKSKKFSFFNYSDDIIKVYQNDDLSIKFFTTCKGSENYKNWHLKFEKFPYELKGYSSKCRYEKPIGYLEHISIYSDISRKYYSNGYLFLPGFFDDEYKSDTISIPNEIISDNFFDELLNILCEKLKYVKNNKNHISYKQLINALNDSILPYKYIIIQYDNKIWQIEENTKPSIYCTSNYKGSTYKMKLIELISYVEIGMAEAIII